MVCEKCKQNEATVHLTQVVDGGIKKVHLCESCAKQSGFDVQGPVSITDILLGMGLQKDDAEASVREISCPRCHMNRVDFKKTGRLGCPECYVTFAEELAPLLKAMHRGSRHVGKYPAREKTRYLVTEKLEQLKRELEKAIHEEAYEAAAKIRDRIQACQAELTEAAGRADA